MLAQCDLTVTKICFSQLSVFSTNDGRFATFGQLAIGLTAGAAAEVTRRALRFGSPAEQNTADRVYGAENPFLTEANANRIVATLCRVRFFEANSNFFRVTSVKRKIIHSLYCPGSWSSTQTRPDALHPGQLLILMFSGSFSIQFKSYEFSQDSELVPQPVLDLFERVRHSADFMPLSQVRL